MSYSKITSFAVKDTLADNDPLKVVRGKEFDDEFDAIATSIAISDATLSTLVTIPTGSIMMHASTTPPGFLLCDGGAKSRLTYAALFAAIGTTYGAGDNITTFNVPNLAGRFPFGTTPGSSGGSADAIVVSHGHGASTSIHIGDPGHAHTSPAGTFAGTTSGGSGGVGYAGYGNDAVPTTNSSATGITASASTSIVLTGVSGVGANLPPFLGVVFIIKT